jgi:NADH dehydrogenase FAD-containing subunit
MAHVGVLGAGLGGASPAYELKETRESTAKITVISNKPFFQFTPSNLWARVGWRNIHKGVSEPFYEKAIMKMMNVNKIES